MTPLTDNTLVSAGDVLDVRISYTPVPGFAPTEDDLANALTSDSVNYNLMAVNIGIISGVSVEVQIANGTMSVAQLKQQIMNMLLNYSQLTRSLFGLSIDSVSDHSSAPSSITDVIKNFSDGLTNGVKNIFNSNPNSSGVATSTTITVVAIAVIVLVIGVVVYKAT